MGSEPLFITVRFDRPEYHGLRHDGSVDWPPSPVRLLGALISGAHGLGEGDFGEGRSGRTVGDGHSENVSHNPRDLALRAIQKISESPPPTIHVPRAVGLRLPGTYTQKSGLDAAGKGSKSHMKDFLDLSLVNLDTLSRTLKPVDGVALESPMVVYELDVNLDSHEAEALRSAAWLIPYFGRSTDPAAVDLTYDQPQMAGFRPLTGSPNTAGSTRGWTPASVDWYDINYERLFGGGDLPLPAVPDIGYVQPLHYGLGVYRPPTDIVPLTQSVPNYKISGLFQTLLNEVGFELSAGIEIFPAVNAGHPQSDGRCLGIGLVALDDRIARPPEWLAAAASELAPLLWERPLTKYQVGPTPNLHSWALQPGRWMGASQAWVSATPYRGFPDEMVVRHVVGEEIMRDFGLESEVVAYPSPRKRFDHRWSQGRFSDGLMDWWLEIHLPAPIHGPFLLRNNQRLGTGLLVPEQREARPDRKERDHA